MQHRAPVPSAGGNLGLFGRIAQLARALPLQGRCRGFESLCAHRSTRCYALRRSVESQARGNAVGNESGRGIVGGSFNTPAMTPTGLWDCSHRGIGLLPPGVRSVPRDGVCRRGSCRGHVGGRRRRRSSCRRCARFGPGTGRTFGAGVVMVRRSPSSRSCRSARSRSTASSSARRRSLPSLIQLARTCSRSSSFSARRRAALVVLSSALSASMVSPSWRTWSQATAASSPDSRATSMVGGSSSPRSRARKARTRSASERHLRGRPPFPGTVMGVIVTKRNDSCTRRVIVCEGAA